MNPIPATDYLRILPELVLTIFGVIVMMADPLVKVTVPEAMLVGVSRSLGAAVL